jgi:hypothetical protein
MSYDASKVKAIEIRADGFNTYGYDVDPIPGYCEVIENNVLITTMFRGPNKSMQPLITLYECDKTLKKTEVTKSGESINPCYTDLNCRNYCSCHGCLAACGKSQKWKDMTGKDHQSVAQRNLEPSEDLVKKLAENIAWQDLFLLLEIYGYWGFTQDPRYHVAKEKILNGSFSDITKEEYKQILGALKSAESKLSKSPSNQVQEKAYLIRQVIYHGRDVGFNGFTELKDKYGGCYIATVAYGSYDAPQVRVLRNYRDNYLEKRRWGQKFVQVYYKYSPYAATKLEGKHRINSILRTILNVFVHYWQRHIV